MRIPGHRNTRVTNLRLRSPQLKENIGGTTALSLRDLKRANNPQFSELLNIIRMRDFQTLSELLPRLSKLKPSKNQLREFHDLTSSIAAPEFVDNILPQLIEFIIPSQENSPLTRIDVLSVIGQKGRALNEAHAWLTNNSENATTTKLLKLLNSLQSCLSLNPEVYEPASNIQIEEAPLLPDSDNSLETAMQLSGTDSLDRNVLYLIIDALKRENQTDEVAGILNSLEAQNLKNISLNILEEIQRETARRDLSSIDGVRAFFDDICDFVETNQGFPSDIESRVASLVELNEGNHNLISQVVDETRIQVSENPIVNLPKFGGIAHIVSEINRLSQNRFHDLEYSIETSFLESLLRLPIDDNFFNVISRLPFIERPSIIEDLVEHLDESFISYDSLYNGIVQIGQNNLISASSKQRLQNVLTNKLLPLITTYGHIPSIEEYETIEGFLEQTGNSQIERLHLWVEVPTFIRASGVLTQNYQTTLENFFPYVHTLTPQEMRLQGLESTKSILFTRETLENLESLPIANRIVFLNSLNTKLDQTKLEISELLNKLNPIFRKRIIDLLSSENINKDQLIPASHLLDALLHPRQNNLGDDVIIDLLQNTTAEGMKALYRYRRSRSEDSYSALDEAVVFSHHLILNSNQEIDPDFMDMLLSDVHSLAERVMNDLNELSTNDRAQGFVERKTKYAPILESYFWESYPITDEQRNDPSILHETILGQIKDSLGVLEIHSLNLQLNSRQAERNTTLDDRLSSNLLAKLEEINRLGLRFSDPHDLLLRINEQLNTSSEEGIQSIVERYTLAQIGDFLTSSIRIGDNLKQELEQMKSLIERNQEYLPTSGELMKIFTFAEQEFPSSIGTSKVDILEVCETLMRGDQTDIPSARGTIQNSIATVLNAIEARKEKSRTALSRILSPYMNTSNFGQDMELAEFFFLNQQIAQGLERLSRYPNPFEHISGSSSLNLSNLLQYVNALSSAITVLPENLSERFSSIYERLVPLLNQTLTGENVSFKGKDLNRFFCYVQTFLNKADGSAESITQAQQLHEVLLKQSLTNPHENKINRDLIQAVNSFLSSSTLDNASQSESTTATQGGVTSSNQLILEMLNQPLSEEQLNQLSETVVRGALNGEQLRELVITDLEESSLEKLIMKLNILETAYQQAPEELMSLHSELFERIMEQIQTRELTPGDLTNLNHIVEDISLSSLLINGSTQQIAILHTVHNFLSKLSQAATSNHSLDLRLRGALNSFYSDEQVIEAGINPTESSMSLLYGTMEITAPTNNRTLHLNREGLFPLANQTLIELYKQDPKRFSGELNLYITNLFSGILSDHQNTEQQIQLIKESVDLVNDVPTIKRIFNDLLRMTMDNELLDLSTDSYSSMREALQYLQQKIEPEINLPADDQFSEFTGASNRFDRRLTDLSNYILNSVGLIESRTLANLLKRWADKVDSSIKLAPLLLPPAKRILFNGLTQRAFSRREEWSENETNLMILSRFQLANSLKYLTSPHINLSQILQFQVQTSEGLYYLLNEINSFPFKGVSIGVINFLLRDALTPFTSLLFESEDCLRLYGDLRGKLCPIDPQDLDADSPITIPKILTGLGLNYSPTSADIDLFKGKWQSLIERENFVSGLVADNVVKNSNIEDLLNSYENNPNSSLLDLIFQSYKLFKSPPQQFVEDITRLLQRQEQISASTQEYLLKQLLCIGGRLPNNLSKITTSTGDGKNILMEVIQEFIPVTEFHETYPQTLIPIRRRDHFANQVQRLVQQHPELMNDEAATLLNSHPLFRGYFTELFEKHYKLDDLNLEQLKSLLNESTEERKAILSEVILQKNSNVPLSEEGAQELIALYNLTDSTTVKRRAVETLMSKLADLVNYNQHVRYNESDEPLSMIQSPFLEDYRGRPLAVYFVEPNLSRSAAEVIEDILLIIDREIQANRHPPLKDIMTSWLAVLGSRETFASQNVIHNLKERVLNATPHELNASPREFSELVETLIELYDYDSFVKLVKKAHPEVLQIIEPFITRYSKECDLCEESEIQRALDLVESVGELDRRSIVGFLDQIFGEEDDVHESVPIWERADSENLYKLIKALDDQLNTIKYKNFKYPGRREEILQTIDQIQNPTIKKISSTILDFQRLPVDTLSKFALKILRTNDDDPAISRLVEIISNAIFLSDPTYLVDRTHLLSRLESKVLVPLLVEVYKNSDTNVWLSLLKHDAHKKNNISEDVFNAYLISHNSPEQLEEFVLKTLGFLKTLSSETNRSKVIKSLGKLCNDTRFTNLAPKIFEGFLENNDQEGLRHFALVLDPSIHSETVGLIKDLIKEQLQARDLDYPEAVSLITPLLLILAKEGNVDELLEILPSPAAKKDLQTKSYGTFFSLDPLTFHEENTEVKFEDLLELICRNLESRPEALIQFLRGISERHLPFVVKKALENKDSSHFKDLLRGIPLNARDLSLINALRIALVTNNEEFIKTNISDLPIQQLNFKELYQYYKITDDRLEEIFDSGEDDVTRYHDSNLISIRLQEGLLTKDKLEEEIALGIKTDAWDATLFSNIAGLIDYLIQKGELTEAVNRIGHYQKIFTDPVKGEYPVESESVGIYFHRLWSKIFHKAIESNQDSLIEQNLEEVLQGNNTTLEQGESVPHSIRSNLAEWLKSRSQGLNPISQIRCLSVINALYGTSYEQLNSQIFHGLTLLSPEERSVHYDTQQTYDLRMAAKYCLEKNQYELALELIDFAMNRSNAGKLEVETAMEVVLQSMSRNLDVGKQIVLKRLFEKAQSLNSGFGEKGVIAQANLEGMLKLRPEYNQIINSDNDDLNDPGSNDTEPPRPSSPGGGNSPSGNSGPILGNDGSNQLNPSESNSGGGPSQNLSGSSPSEGLTGNNTTDLRGLIDHTDLQSILEEQRLAGNAAVLNPGQLPDDLSGWNLSGVKIINADLRSKTFEVVSDLSGADFSGSRLPSLNSNVQLVKLNFEGATFYPFSKLPDLSNSTIMGAHFTGNKLGALPTDMRYVTFEAVDLSKANLEYKDLKGAIFLGSTLPTSFVGSNLSEVNLSSQRLEGFNFEGANLSKVNFSNANLRGANLKGADLRGADLRNTDLRGANLSGANLEGAKIHGADLSNTPSENLESITPLNKIEGWSLVKFDDGFPLKVSQDEQLLSIIPSGLPLSISLNPASTQLDTITKGPRSVTLYEVQPFELRGILEEWSIYHSRQDNPGVFEQYLPSYSIKTPLHKFHRNRWYVDKMLGQSENCSGICLVDDKGQLIGLAAVDRLTGKVDSWASNPGIIASNEVTVNEIYQLLLEAVSREVLKTGNPLILPKDGTPSESIVIDVSTAVGFLKGSFGYTNNRILELKPQGVTEEEIATIQRAENLEVVPTSLILPEDFLANQIDELSMLLSGSDDGKVLDKLGAAYHRLGSNPDSPQALGLLETLVGLSPDGYIPPESTIVSILEKQSTYPQTPTNQRILDDLSTKFGRVSAPSSSDNFEQETDEREPYWYISTRSFLDGSSREILDGIEDSSKQTLGWLRKVHKSGSVFCDFAMLQRTNRQLDLLHEEKYSLERERIEIIKSSEASMKAIEEVELQLVKLQGIASTLENVGTSSAKDRLSQTLEDIEALKKTKNDLLLRLNSGVSDQLPQTERIESKLSKVQAQIEDHLNQRKYWHSKALSFGVNLSTPYTFISSEEHNRARTDIYSILAKRNLTAEDIGFVHQLIRAHRKGLQVPGIQSEKEADALTDMTRASILRLDDTPVVETTKSPFERIKQRIQGQKIEKPLTEREKAVRVLFGGHDFLSRVPRADVLNRLGYDPIKDKGGSQYLQRQTEIAFARGKYGLQGSLPQRLDETDQDYENRLKRHLRRLIGWEEGVPFEVFVQDTALKMAHRGSQIDLKRPVESLQRFVLLRQLPETTQETLNKYHLSRETINEFLAKKVEDVERQLSQVGIRSDEQIQDAVNKALREYGITERWQTEEERLEAFRSLHGLRGYELLDSHLANFNHELAQQITKEREDSVEKVLRRFIDLRINDLPMTESSQETYIQTQLALKLAETLGIQPGEEFSSFATKLPITLDSTTISTQEELINFANSLEREITDKLNADIRSKRKQIEKDLSIEEKADLESMIEETHRQVTLIHAEQNGRILEEERAKAIRNYAEGQWRTTTQLPLDQEAREKYIQESAAKTVQTYKNTIGMYSSESWDEFEQRLRNSDNVRYLEQIKQDWEITNQNDWESLLNSTKSLAEGRLQEQMEAEISRVEKTLLETPPEELNQLIQATESSTYKSLGFRKITETGTEMLDRRAKVEKGIARKYGFSDHQELLEFITSNREIPGTRRILSPDEAINSIFVRPFQKVIDDAVQQLHELGDDAGDSIGRIKQRMSEWTTTLNHLAHNAKQRGEESLATQLKQQVEEIGQKANQQLEDSLIVGALRRAVNVVGEMHDDLRELADDQRMTCENLLRDLEDPSTPITEDLRKAALDTLGNINRAFPDNPIEKILSSVGDHLPEGIKQRFTSLTESDQPTESDELAKPKITDQAFDRLNQAEKIIQIAERELTGVSGIPQVNIDELPRDSLITPVDVIVEAQSEIEEANSSSNLYQLVREIVRDPNKASDEDLAEVARQMRSLAERDATQGIVLNNSALAATELLKLLPPDQVERYNSIFASIDDEIQTSEGQETIPIIDGGYEDNVSGSTGLISNQSSPEEVDDLGVVSPVDLSVTQQPVNRRNIPTQPPEEIELPLPED
jgi:uncharacterized protein YjbI with pentapeptide repeats